MSPVTPVSSAGDGILQPDEPKQDKQGSNREKFVNLAEKRTSKALQAISVIGNLSNRSNYSYTDEDVRQIKRALINQVNIMIARFGGQTKKTSGFSLK